MQIIIKRKVNDVEPEGPSPILLSRINSIIIIRTFIIQGMIIIKQLIPISAVVPSTNQHRKDILGQTVLRLQGVTATIVE